MPQQGRLFLSTGNRNSERIFTFLLTADPWTDGADEEFLDIALCQRGSRDVMHIRRRISLRHQLQRPHAIAPNFQQQVKCICRPRTKPALDSLPDLPIIRQQIIKKFLNPLAVWLL